MRNETEPPATTLCQPKTLQLTGEEKLRASEEMLRRALASSLDCVKILDLAGRPLWTNEGFRPGMEFDDFDHHRNVSWPEFWAEEDRATVREAITSAAAGNAGRFTGCHRTAGNELKYLDVVVTPIFGVRAAPEKLLCVMRDITEHAIAANTLRVAEAKYRALFENAVDGIFQVSRLLKKSGTVGK